MAVGRKLQVLALVGTVVMVALAMSPGRAGARLEVSNGKIAYVDTLSSTPLTVYEPGDATSRHLETQPRAVLGPAFSPDGGSIAWVPGGPAAGFDVNAINADGGNPRPLAATPNVPESEPAYFLDGSQIAYLRSNTDQEGGDIWAMNADGSNQHVLIATPNLIESEPAPSPDGHHIAYTFSRGAFEQHIAVTDLDTGSFTQLTKPSDSDPAATQGGDEFGPVYSPDGQKIAFARVGTSGQSFLNSVWIMNADGSGQTRLTGDDVSVQSIAWSPDGQHLLLSAQNGGTPFPISGPTGERHLDLYEISPDGSNLTVLPNTRNADDADWQRQIHSVGKGCNGAGHLVAGAPGPNRLEGSAGRDVIDGEEGDDLIAGLGGKDQICGSAGNDKLLGGGGKDRLYGGPGNDILIGGPGKDLLVGGPGKDRIVKGRGDVVRP